MVEDNTAIRGNAVPEQPVPRSKISQRTKELCHMPNERGWAGESIKLPLFTREAIFVLVVIAKFVKICQRSASMVRIRYMGMLSLAYAVAIAVSQELSLYFVAKNSY